MPISATRPPRAEKPPRAERQAGGFTLLELLLVTALLGFLVSLLLPRLDQLYLRFLFWLDQDRVEREIAALSGRAFLEGKAFSLATSPPSTTAGRRSAAEPLGGEGEPVRLALPEGWRVSVEPAILFRPDGSCSGGEVAIEAGDIVRRFRLEPPRCRIR